MQKHIRMAFVLATLMCNVPLNAQNSAAIKSNGNNPIVSPDGHFVVYRSENSESPGIYRVDADGKNRVRVYDIVSNVTQPVFSNDGKRLLYAHRAPDAIHLFSTDINGDDNKQFGAITAAATLSVAISGDASRVVYGANGWNDTQLFASGLEAKPAVKLTPGVDAFWCQQFSRDGKLIAAGRRVKGVGMQVWVMNVDGSSVRQLTHFPKSDGDPQCPTWSSDGKQLALQSAVRLASDTTKFVGTIWLVDVATGSAKQLGKHSAPYRDETPSLFPDGRVAFQSNRSGQWEVWIMNADGSGARQLTGTAVAELR
ncbi:MAG: hypothetical protein ABJB66_00985 [Gemmatimonadaceae bacterium]